MVSKSHNFGKVKDIGFNLIRRILKILFKAKRPQVFCT